MLKQFMQLGPLFALILLTLALWLGVATFAKAQHVEYEELLFLNAVTTTVSGPLYPVSGYQTVAFDLDISAGTATIRVDISVDQSSFQSVTCMIGTQLDRTTGGALVSYGTNGVYQCNIAGAQTLRLRTNACAGCTVTARGRVTTAKMSQ